MNCSLKQYSMVGISLIELLIAMTLSILLGMALFLSYSKIREHLKQEQIRVWIYENARGASQVLTHTIRDAGFIGCAKLTAEFTQYLHDPYKRLNLNNSLIGFNEQALENFPERLRNRIKKGSTGIMIRKMSPRTTVLTQPMTNRTHLVISSQPKFAIGNMMLISNCLQADIFKIKEITHTESQQLIHTESPLKHRYPLFAEVAELSEEAFYIADTGRLTKQGKAIFALYRFDFRGHGVEEEIVEGVEDMHLYYGVLSQHKITYVPMAAVMRWQDVYAVQVVLLLSSQEPYYQAAKSYVFDGQQYFAKDRYLRQEWQFFVILRERALQ